MEQKQISTVKTHVVWLDVVRLIAMFTVVCCHCTDPFNFYPGDSPIIGNIKFWGAAYGAFLSSLCTSVRYDYGSLVATGPGRDFYFL